MKTQKKSFLYGCLLSFFLGAGLFSLGAEEFFYTHREGDQYRILSRVNENVYVDRVLHHRAEILNRIRVEVLGEEGGTGTLKAVFETAEKALGTDGSVQGKVYEWTRDYESRFERESLGRLHIDEGYFMPVVRDVPVFSGEDLQPGDTWTGEGQEVHDFRTSFGIGEPYRIPFTAQYTFLGQRTWQGKEYPAFQVKYRVFDEPPEVPGRLWPLRIQEASDQIIFWDREAGQPRAYSEDFRVILELSNGTTVEYRGKARGELIEAPEMDRRGIAEEIQEDIERLGLEDVEIRVDEEGITLTLENIQFAPDSAILLGTEKVKLDRIGEILKRYADRDILVSGHTALAGTASSRKKLSVDRAGAVADYLVEKQIRPEDRITIRGFGAERPLASNSTPEGMRKNRRVEITILEN